MTLELIYGDSWESRSSVVLSLILVDFVDGSSGVSNWWLDNLLLGDWLNVLVNVVADVLACNGWVGKLSVLNLADFRGCF